MSPIFRPLPPIFRLRRPPAPPPPRPATPPGHREPTSRPIHLTASTTLSPGSTKGVNALALKNPHDLPMEIREIKFQLAAAFNADTAPRFTGSAVGVKLDLGKFSMTGGFVPVFCFGRAENFLNEENPYGGASTTQVLEYNWKLPIPLYVPAQSVIVPNFQHFAQVAFDIEARISFSAQMFPSKYHRPKTVALPYAAVWAAKSIPLQDAGADESTETDLLNPFDEPLILQRFSGRVANYREADGYYFEAQENLPGTTYSVRMADSLNQPFVREYTGFRQVFSAVTRSWELNGVALPPKTFVKVELIKDALDIDDRIDITQAFVGMIGHREMPWNGV